MTSDSKSDSSWIDPSHHEWNSLISPPVASLAEIPQPDKPLKLGIMASGSGSNFEAIAQAISDGQLNAQIRVMVYNNPGIKAVERAQRWAIPSMLLNHREFASREALDEAIVDTFKTHQVDWVVMAGWMRRVTNVLINAFPQRVLNIHPSLLPSFPGVRAVEQALQAGVKITGCTVHHVILEVDRGPIVMQAAVPILPIDTVDTLHRRIQAQEHRIYPLAIALAGASEEVRVRDIN
jgi:phosphoribosylglycinamide formyltransferase-1